MTNTLYYGDNLKVLRDYIADESVDLIYLDPPFNSNASYNMLFKSPDGSDSDAQINAFDDTWQWGVAAEEAVDYVRDSGQHKTYDLLDTMRGFLGDNAMMAYLAMMAARLIELHRVLKDTGSLYLHCDPTASHYLKILLDGVFGAANYRSEIIWKRTSTHNSAKRWGPVHDVLFYYSKSNEYVWNSVFEAYDQKYLDRFYRYEDEKGKFTVGDLTGAGTREGKSGEAWKGFDPTERGRHWAIPNAAIKRAGINGDFLRLSPQEKLDFLDKHGFIYWPPQGSVPRFKRYLETDRGVPAQDIISDIGPLSAQAKERLGYPTQKPLALLERIISASSNAGDVVLEPFCGCGTALDAAEKLNRQWVGIDITHLAINLIEARMQDAHPDAKFVVKGRPESLAGAQELARRDKHEFEKWIVPKLEGHLFEGGRKGADGGIDGFIYFRPDGKKDEKAILSVKGGDNVGVAMIRDLHSTMEREKALAGMFVTKAPPTKSMMAEAAKVGLFEAEAMGGRKFPRLQILTLDQVFQCESADLPYIVSPYKKARRHDKAEQGKLL